MILTQETRRHPRIPYPGPVRISWEDYGSPRFALAKCVDISEAGIRLEAPQAIPRGAIVQLAADRIRLNGSATVKSSVRTGAKYSVGLELSHTDRNPVISAAALIENLNRTH